MGPLCYWLRILCAIVPQLDDSSKLSLSGPRVAKLRQMSGDSDLIHFSGSKSTFIHLLTLNVSHKLAFWGSGRAIILYRLFFIICSVLAPTLVLTNPVSTAVIRPTMSTWLTLHLVRPIYVSPCLAQLCYALRGVLTTIVGESVSF